MEQAKGLNESPQWRKLEAKDFGQEMPLANELINIFSSQDYILFLKSSEVLVYNQKSFIWTKHQIKKEPDAEEMTSASCFARPGLIIDFPNSKLSKLVLLSFDTEGEELKNFCQKAKQLDNMILPWISSFAIASDQKSIYLFGGQKTKVANAENGYYRKFANSSNDLYRIELDTFHISELCIDGVKPCARSNSKIFFFRNKLFVFGGHESKGGYGGSKFFMDFWVLFLSGMKWVNLTDKRLLSVLQYPFYVFAYNEEIFLCHGDSDDKKQHLYSILNYSFSKNCWEIFNSSLSNPENSTIGFSRSGNSILRLEKHDATKKIEIYSLEIPSKTKKPKADQLGNLMPQLWEGRNHADVIFKVEDEEIPAHKCILSAKCPYFKNVFSSDMMESHSSVIPVADVQAKVFKAMLQYVYLSQVDLTSEIAEGLFKLAHEYRLEELKDECEEFLKGDVKVENVVKMIHLAQTYEASQLKKISLVFIAKNIDEVFKTQNIHELDKETLLELYKIKN